MSVFSLDRPEDYKLHLACWNQKDQPLDVYIRSRDEWDTWNTWRSSKNEFNRRFIFSLIDFYLEPNIWLFGGIYEVLSRSSQAHAHSYKVRRCEEGEALVGRLKVRFGRPGRNKSVTLERYLPEMTVSEVLKEPYTGERFPGYENISHDFRDLKRIFESQRPDWRAALEHVKGVYVIVDKSNGKKYVGAAHGEMGIWARWECYMETGHGWNDELTKLIKKEGMSYAEENFRLTLLEYRSALTEDQVIIDREGFWKEALLSRTPFGYNKN